MTDRIRSITVSDLITENLEVFSRLGVIHATDRILALVSDRDLAVTLLLHARKAWPDPQAADPSSVLDPFMEGKRSLSANLSSTGIRFWIYSYDGLGLAVVFLAEECRTLSWPDASQQPSPHEILALQFV
jgi:hypothetical protein